MRLRFLCLVFLSAPAAAFAQTRPLLTEQAGTAPKGTVVLELGADLMREEPNFITGRERTRVDGPVLRLVWSPADQVEIDVEWTSRVRALDDPDFGTVSDWGDVALRAKVRLVEEGPRRPGLAARFAVTLPETSFGNGLGPNALRMSAQLIASNCGGVCAHANAGLAIHDEVLRPHEQRDFIHFGVALEAPAGTPFAMVAEVNGLAGRGAPGAEARSEARGGFRWRTGRLRWDAALRRGLTRSDGEWGLTFGLAWTMAGG